MRNHSKWVRLLIGLPLVALVSYFAISMLPQRAPSGVLPQLSQGQTAFALEPADRIMVLAPHPDDDVLGCGGIIQQAVQTRLPLRVLFLTYGDSNEWSFMVYEKRPV